MYRHTVAPPAGAWIETLMGSDSMDEDESPPLRGRGLKPRRSGIVR